MTIKKNFIELVTFLEANKNKKVSTILNDVIAMTEAKVQQTTHYRDEEGDVVAIYCYFHKRWENSTIVEYGLKKSSSTGLNTMCKLGVRGWTKHQKLLKQLDATLLSQVISGDLDATEIKTRKADAIIELQSDIQEEYKQEETLYLTDKEIAIFTKVSEQEA